MPELDLDDSAVSSSIPKVKRKLAAGLFQWLGRGLAVVALCGIGMVLRDRPSRVVLPFPWQSSLRGDLHEELRASRHKGIDRAAKTFHLVEGRFPDRLEELRDRSLISEDDLLDEEGRLVVFLSEGVSYVVQSREDGGLLASTASTEAITGDFILDPDFVQVLPESEAVPLVLLD